MHRRERRELYARPFLVLIFVALGELHALVRRAYELAQVVYIGVCCLLVKRGFALVVGRDEEELLEVVEQRDGEVLSRDPLLDSGLRYSVIGKKYREVELAGLRVDQRMVDGRGEVHGGRHHWIFLREADYEAQDGVLVVSLANEYHAVPP